METKSSTFKIKSAPHPSLVRHRQQRTWQILLPMIVGGLALLTIAVMIILTATRSDPGGNLSIWADTSLIWLLMPVMGFAVLIVAFLGLMVYLVARVLKLLPPYTSSAQHYARQIATKVGYWSNKLVSPFIKVRSLKAGADQAVTNLARSFRN